MTLPDLVNMQEAGFLTKTGLASPSCTLHSFLVSVAASCLYQTLSAPSLFALELQLSFLQHDTSRRIVFRCFSFIKACSSKGCNVNVKRSQSQGELMWWLWTMYQPQLASPRMRLGLSCCSSSYCVSSVTVIKGISLLESQLGMVGLHFVQFSLMTKS